MDRYLDTGKWVQNKSLPHWGERGCSERVNSNQRGDGRMPRGKIIPCGEVKHCYMVGGETHRGEEGVFAREEGGGRTRGYREIAWGGKNKVLYQLKRLSCRTKICITRCKGAAFGIC